MPSPTGLVNITINGRPFQARAGQTVLEAAADAGVTIPALCHHPAIKPHAACRVCLVEIEKQRTLQPACTFPIFDGMVIRTESEKAVNSRKFALQMIFSERNHYCMICPQSGTGESTDCELQKLAYQYGMSSWLYAPDYHKQWPIDASRKYFVLDHSRCILCRRCVRVCEEVSANHTLGVHQRGARTMICADDDVAFGDSSCISCGTCLQVCPTGALVDRYSAFLGHDSDVARTPAVCMGCAVGCGIHAITRDNQLLRVEGDWTAPNHGLLCSTGRFDVVQPKPQRIHWPMVRSNGQMVETSWDKALGLVAERFEAAHRVAGLVSPRMTNESLAAFGCFFDEVLESSEVALLYGEVPPTDLGATASLADVARADCIVLIGGDPLEFQKVVGYLVKRALDNDAKLIVVNDASTDLDPRASMRLPLQNISAADADPFELLRLTYHLRIDNISQVKSKVEEADRPVVLYGAGLSTTVYAAMRTLPAKTRFLPLVKGANAVGASRLGLAVHPVRGDALYVLAGDDMPEGQALPKAQFTVVQAAFESDWTDAADVVLPGRVWNEKRGHIVNMEGRTLDVQPLIQAPKSIHADWETLLMLSVRMGHVLPYDAIPDIAMAL